MRKTTGFIWLLNFYLVPALSAQEREVTHSPISIISKKPSQRQGAYSLDSVRANLLTGTAQAISELPGVYCKDYGPGALATLSVRGTAAAHTPVMWNGVPISNAMLGMSDLSLLGGNLISGAKLASGGEALVGVSEDFGGVLELASGPATANHIRYGTAVGSYSNLANHLDVNRILGKAGIGLKAWNLYGINDFRYRQDGEERTQTHAKREQKGMVLSALLPLTSSIKIDVAGWWQANHRQLAPSMYEPVSEATQKDESQRISARFIWTSLNWKINTVHGYTKENLLYEDPLAAIHSLTSTIGVFNSLNVSRKTRRIESGINGWLGQYQANTPSYANKAKLQRLSGMVWSKYRSENGRFEAVGSVKGEMARYSIPLRVSLPISPSLTMAYSDSVAGTFHIGVHRKYRLPTLNDLYWTPGGNPNLSPETGWTSEIRWKRRVRFSPEWGYRPEVEYFHSLINHYIQWLPQGTYWQARNVTAVAISGLIATQRIEYQRGLHRISVLVEGSYIRSMQSKSRFPGDEGVGKQLIYVPVFQWQNRVEYKYRKVMLSVWHQHIGRRFVSPANDEWLPSFATFNARVSWQCSVLQTLDCHFFSEALNLAGQSYQTIKGYAMPLARFSVGLQTTLNK